jgi:hypothetical protein
MSIKRDYNAETLRMKHSVAELPSKISAAKDNLELIRIDKAKTQFSELRVYQGSRSVAESELAILLNKAITDALKNPGEVVEIGKVGNVNGLTLSAVSFEDIKGENLLSETVTKVNFVVKGNFEYKAEAGLAENSNNILRIKNLLNGVIPIREENFEKHIEKLENNLAQVIERAEKPFERDGEIAALEKRIEELDTILSEVTEQNDDLDVDDVIDETPEEKAVREEFNNKFDDEDDYQPPMPKVKNVPGNAPKRT